MIKLVNRGGSWYDGPRWMRAAYRGWLPHDDWHDALGFRLVQEEETYDTPHVVRGGSWNNYPWNLRPANRYRFNAGFRYFYLGFRLVQEE